jgi:hypothetical protein
MVTEIAVKTSNAQQESTEQKATWISTIYIEKQIQTDQEDQFITGLRQINRQPMLRNFQWFDLTSNHKEGDAVPSYNFFLHPGTNMGLMEKLPDDRQLIERFPVETFKRVFDQKLNKRLLFENDPFFPSDGITERLGFIRVLIPDFPDDIGEPGYRHYNDDKAALLIKSHMHASWIKRALAGEKRPNIQILAEKRIERLIEIEKQLQSGV